MDTSLMEQQIGDAVPYGITQFTIQLLKLDTLWLVYEQRKCIIFCWAQAVAALMV